MNHDGQWGPVSVGLCVVAAAGFGVWVLGFVTLFRWVF
jgi:hypothetical protein